MFAKRNGFINFWSFEKGNIYNILLRALKRVYFSKWIRCNLNREQQ